jgi:hypothetical protein
MEGRGRVGVAVKSFFNRNARVYVAFCCGFGAVCDSGTAGSGSEVGSLKMRTLILSLPEPILYVSMKGEDAFSFEGEDSGATTGESAADVAFSSCAACIGFSLAG